MYHFSHPDGGVEYNQLYIRTSGKFIEKHINAKSNPVLPTSKAKNMRAIKLRKLYRLAL
jgi:hypothetical protein